MSIDRFDKRLSLVGSEDRAAVLLDCVRECEPAEGRELLAHWFNVCDALKDQALDLREEFRRVGWVTDLAGVKQPEREFTVYRASWHDDDPTDAISWTVDEKVAQFFARYLTGARAWFLGMRREDAWPVVWRGTCFEALGYISGRGEREVIVGTVEDVEMLSMLGSPDEVAQYEKTGVLPWDA